MNKVLFLILIACALSFSSCQNSSPKLVPDVPAGKANQKVDLGKEGLVTQLDVLFVVDDSGSMDPHQHNLSSNIDLFTQEFTKSAFVDYHVGVITSSVGSRADCGNVGCNGLLVGSPNWIERSTPNAIAELQKNFIVGTSGNYIERFYQPLMMALQPPAVDKQNKGFYRPRAHLAVIFVTDSDDQSENVSSDDFYDFLFKLKGRTDKFSVYAAYIPTASVGCSRSSEPEPNKLEKLFAKTGAVTVGLCDPQFGKKLAEVGKDLFRRIARKMYLNRRPLEGSIKVIYGNIELPRDLNKGWTYDPSSNSINFGEQVDWDAQPQGSNLDIEYTPVD